MSLQACFCLFSPSVSRVAIVSKSFEGKTDRTEQWYGTQYKQEAIPEEVIQVGLRHLWISLNYEELGEPRSRRSFLAGSRAWRVMAPSSLRPWEGSEELEVSHEASCSGSFPSVYKPQTPSLPASEHWSVGNTVAQHQEGKRRERQGKLRRAGCAATVLAGACSPGGGSTGFIFC